MTTSKPKTEGPARSGNPLLTAAALIGVGAGIGLMIPPEGPRGLVARWLTPPDAGTIDTPDTGADEHAGHDHGEPIDGAFAVSVAAQKTYGLTVGKAKPGAFTQYVKVPAFVRERPAVSNLKASGRLQGVVHRVFVQVGQSVREGDPLVELEVTGEELAIAQSTLLDSVEKLSTIDDEIARLEPAASAGGIARKSLIEKQYEQRRTRSLIRAKRQELLIRGLSESDVTNIVENRELVRKVVIRVPTDIRPQKSNRTTKVGESTSRSEQHVPPSDEWVYSVEMLHVSPGSVLSSGHPVCDLAFHETLLIEGQAYERDLPMLTRLIKDNQTVSVSLGEGTNPAVFSELPILFINNHVDKVTQTYRFYVEITNSVVTESIDGNDRRFRTWQFKPGQRGHIGLPQNSWTDRLVLPAAAVAEDGVDNVIFHRAAHHDHFHGSEPPHSEFKKLVVKVDYRDQHTVVVDALDQLKSRHMIATNCADMLLRAMNDNTGGGHAHHGHDH